MNIEVGIMDMQEILEIERQHIQRKTDDKIRKAREKNRQDLLISGIAIINMQTTAIVMAAFAGINNP